MKHKTLCITLASLLFPLGAAAQYTIYPTPHQQVAGTGTVSLTPTVTLVAETGIDSYTVDRAKQVLTEHGLKVETADAPSTTQANLFLGIAGSDGAADKQATALGLTRDVFTTAGKFDRHILSLTANGGHADIVALGETTNATFFALASLEQMLDQGTTDLPTTTLYDYADQQSRGIVEGYYGYPYSVSVKKDLMRFMMRYKMNTYLYGAKSDPYHSQYWQDAYPTSITAQQEKNGWLSQAMVKDITDESHATKVNFIWAIHPGNNFVGDANVINQIMGKFEKMHDLGVRQFAVFVDDVSVPSSDADMKTNADRLTALQKAIEAKWNGSGAAPADTVRPLHFVPQIYCRSFAGSQDQHDRFFKALSSTPSYVTIYTTGYGVWSVPNESDLALPAGPLGRNVAWWWNYPCNDNADGQIYTMDMKSNFYDLPSVDSNANPPKSLNNSMGLVSNPMQQGEVAKTPLFSVADLAWNVGGFDNQKSWEASFKAVLPGNAEAQAAYRFLAPYLRWNDPDALNSLINTYKSKKDPAALDALMAEIVSNCDVLIKLKDSDKENESLLYNDMAPWLLKLHDMAQLTRDLLAVSASDSKEDSRWTSFLAASGGVDSLSTAEKYKAYALEGMGNGISVSERPSQPANRYLIHFVDYLKQNALGDYFTQEAAPTRPTLVGNVEGLRGQTTGSTTIGAVMSRVATLNKGQWVGIQLAQPVKGTTITLADTLVSNHSVVYSPDGKQWTRLYEAVTEPEGYVRYVGVVNDSETPAPIKLTQRAIRVTLPTTAAAASVTAPAGEVYDNHTAALAADGNYETYACIKKDIRNGDAFTVKLKKTADIHRVRIAINTTNGDYMDEGRVQISADGKNWTDLNVLGTSSPKFTVDLPQVFNWSSDVKVCDFEGDGTAALYVRLLVYKAPAKKWLRLAEIEVNGESYFAQPRCADAVGLSYPAVSDADASTSTAAAAKHNGKGELTYYFQNYKLLNGVTLYADPATLEGATFATSLNLNDWTEVQGEGTQGVVKINFPAEDKAMAALRITWTGDKTPAIYEIVEDADATELPTVTEISQATEGGNAAGDLSVTLTDGQLKAISAKGIKAVTVYNVDGREELTAQADGATTVTTPRLHAATGVKVVKITLADGKVVSYKVR